MEKQRKKEVTVEAVLYEHYTSKKDGTHPVRLKVTANRASRFYPIQFEGKNIFATKPHWKDLQSKALRGAEKKVQQSIADNEAKAREAQRTIMQNNRPFDFIRFEGEFFNRESKKGILSLWDSYLNDLLKEERTGTYTAYKNAYQSFRYFRGMVMKGKEVIKKPSELNPNEITVQTLKDFDSFLLKRGCGKTTVGMYMRALKVVYNLAANDNPSLKEFYPFALKQNDKGKYKIKTGSGSKGETLSPTQLQALINAKTLPGTPEHEAKLLWLFSFHCQGMNFKDLALLKYKDVQWDSIRYIRHKTRDTERKESMMEILMSEAIKQIIVEIGNPNKSPDSYVFDIVTKEQDHVKADAAIRQKIKITNKWLKRLCKDNGLPEITTYAARHTYANLLKQAGESIEMIRELLGHSDMRTTEAYLKRFDLNRKQAVNDKIQAILKAS